MIDIVLVFGSVSCCVFFVGVGIDVVLVKLNVDEDMVKVVM